MKCTIALERKTMYEELKYFSFSFQDSLDSLEIYVAGITN